ncbi:hypothetical protein CC2G_013910 [Coprinopsis cinerea AmutBmut pab1-1]|nr:hypothetical protein CC2G_013910 [Coprinopsis cinerea AmutBmut pab1-1]
MIYWSPTRLHLVSALYFLVYDVILTYGDEVTYIWPIPLNRTKLAFLFIRYFPILFLFSIQFYGTPNVFYSSHDCYIWNAYQAVATILIIAGADYILLLRVFALYPSNRPIKYLTMALYLAELVMTSVGMGLAVPELTYDEHCGVTDAPITFLIAAGVPILFQTYLFGIIAWKFVLSIKEGWGDVPIMSIIMRDNTWAFTLLFLILIAEAFLYGIAEDAYIGILYGWLNAAFSFCGYRILINLNKAARKSPSDASTGASIQFTSNFTTKGDLGLSDSETDAPTENEGQDRAPGKVGEAYEMTPIVGSKGKAKESKFTAASYL